MRRAFPVGIVVVGFIACSDPPDTRTPSDASAPAGDAPADAATGPDVPSWGAGHGWTLSFEVVEAERGEEEAAAQRLSAGLRLWLTAEGHVWAGLGGSTRVGGPIHPTYGPGGTMTVPVTARSGSYCSWTEVDVTLTLSAGATEGDGSLGGLTGTATGSVDWEDFDVSGEPIAFEAVVTGVPDTEPASLHFSVAGRWPTQDVRLRSTEPVCEVDLRAATSLSVDGQPADFDLALSPGDAGPPGATSPKDGGPPGCGSWWRVLPGAALEAGSTLALTVAPVPDLVGNLSEEAALSHTVPPLPEPVEVPWDFSGGSPFVPQTGGVQVAEAYGPVQAPTGGAMAIATLGVADSSRVTVPVPVPNGPSRAVVVLAIAGEPTDVEAARPRLWVRTAAGEREAIISLPPARALGGGAVTPGEDAVTPFAEATIGLAGLPAGVALLDVGLEGAPWDSCFGGPPWGAVKLLIDRIDVTPESAP